MSRSLDLRQRALHALSEGLSQKEVQRVFGISQMTLYRWRQREATNELAPRCSPGGPRKFSPEHEELLLEQLQRFPDATINEHLARWHNEQNHCASRSTCYALDDLIWPILSQVSPHQAINCFKHAGYHLSNSS